MTTVATKTNLTKPAQDAAAPAKNILERVQAFCNLRFPPVIREIEKEKDPAEGEAKQVE